MPPLALLALVACADAEVDRSEFPGPTYSVVMTDGGMAKIAVIKAVREVTGLGLRDAKAMVDSTPSMVKSGLSHAEAKMLEEKLEKAGATIEVKRN